MAANPVLSGRPAVHMRAERRRRPIGADDAPAATSGVRLATAVMFVYDLESSVRFYRELFGMEIRVRDESAALLVSADEFQLYLREKGQRASHALGAVGVQYVIWTAADDEELRRCERFLKDSSAHVATQEVEGFRLVEGRDPSGLPVVVTYPGPDLVERHQIMSRIYPW